MAFSEHPHPNPAAIALGLGAILLARRLARRGRGARGRGNRVPDRCRDRRGGQRPGGGPGGRAARRYLGGDRRPRGRSAAGAGRSPRQRRPGSRRSASRSTSKGSSACRSRAPTTAASSRTSCSSTTSCTCCSAGPRCGRCWRCCAERPFGPGLGAAGAGVGYLLARADLFHLIPLAAVLPILLATDRARAADRASSRSRWRSSTGLIVLHGLDRKRIQALHPPPPALEIDVADGVRAPTAEARSLGKLVRYVRARVGPGEPVFVANPRYDLVKVGNPLVYVLLDRPNPTRYDVMQPGVVTTAEVQREIVADLERAGPELVVRWLAPGRGGGANGAGRRAGCRSSTAIWPAATARIAASGLRRAAPPIGDRAERAGRRPSARHAAGPDAHLVPRRGSDVSGGSRPRRFRGAARRTPCARSRRGSGRLQPRARRARLECHSSTSTGVRSCPGIGVRADRYDGERLPLADGAVDTVIMVEVLEHLDAPGDLLDEAARGGTQCAGNHAELHSAVSRRDDRVQPHARRGPPPVLHGGSLREVLAARFERCEVVQSHPLDESIAGLVLPRPLMSMSCASRAGAVRPRYFSGCWGRAGWPAGSAGDARAGGIR